MANDNHTQSSPDQQPKWCPSCGCALRTERQPNYRRIDGKLVEVEPLWLHTCDQPDCPFAFFTVVSSTFFDPAERKRYGIEYAPYDVVTGRAFEAFELPWWLSNQLAGA